MIYDLIIVGGGPAGLMAANVCETYHLNYLLLEKNDQLAKKLLLTGGKRCNITNNLSVSSFIESLNMKHKRFLYPALTQFSSKQILNFFEERGLRFLLEQDLKYFPETQKSRSVLDALLKDMNKDRIRYVEPVKSIEHDQDLWNVKTHLETYQTKHVMVATGSKAYPTTGSSGDGYHFAHQLGIKMIPLLPAETHVYSDEIKTKYKDMQGISLTQSSLIIEKSKQTYPKGILFTHFGLSGPSVLHASEDIAKRLLEEDVYVRFSLSDSVEKDVLDQFDKALSQNLLLSQFLELIVIKRVVKLLPQWLSIDNKRLKEYSKKDVNLILDTILHFRLKIDRVESLDKAFVNAGGIDVSELDPKSMMVKKYPGLYFVGEINDLQGPIGGFNITIAFSTAHLAAMDIVQRIKQQKDSFA